MATQKGRNWSSGDIVTAANLGSIERGVSAVSSVYEPTTWANGDTVTAAALNNIEQGIVNADGGGNSWQTVFEDDVETHYNDKSGRNSGVMNLDTSLPETIKVTFNGAEYICNQNYNGSYGAVCDFPIDFSEYPFSIMNGSLYVQGEDTTVNSIKIEALQESGSSDFSTAQVTIDFTNLSNEEYTFNLSMPTIVNSPIGDIVVGHIGENDLTGPINTFNAVLSANGCIAMLDTLGVSVVVSGSITQGPEGDIISYRITGDCTITISDSGDTPIST